MTNEEKFGLILMLLAASFLPSTEGTAYWITLGIWFVGIVIFFVGGRKT